MSWINKQLAATIIVSGMVLALVSWAIFVYLPKLSVIEQPTPPTAPSYTYTQGLLVGFRIIDLTSTAPLTSNTRPVFYPSGTNPMSYTFTMAMPSAIAAYDSTKAMWLATLDAGSYALLIQDTAVSPTHYPELKTVTVSGTNNTEATVMLNPSSIGVVQRADIDISATVWAYNTATGAYDIDETATGIDTTTYTRWCLEFRVVVAGIGEMVKAGRFYLPTYQGLTIAQAMLDGQAVTVTADANSADDGHIGYYIQFPDWQAGTHLLCVYIQLTGTSVDGTYTLTMVDYYQCLNPTLRWWTDETEDIAVVAT